jgi:hypothetical protein
VTRPAVLRITVFRVYPSCERIGSFRVRVRAGVNRVRFRGRIRGRALAPGGYRLVVRARGAKRDAAAIPIVIARGSPTRAQVRKARTTVVCDQQVAHVFVAGAPPAADPPDSSGDGGLASMAKKVTGPVSKTARAALGKARELGAGVGARVDEPFHDPSILALLALLVLASCAFGLLLITYLLKEAGVLNEDRRRDA